MNLWIFNHYATNMYFEGAGRHHSLAKFLIQRGIKTTIFCANVIHGRNEEVSIENGMFSKKTGKDGVEYIFVKTTAYHNNGMLRLKNIADFYFGVRKVADKIVEENGKPDIIIGSSVHPLALIAAEKFAKKNKIPCICEIRDLWPETLVELNIIGKNNPLTKIMYKGEHSIYKKANGIIFLMPGGKDYIKDKRWQNDVPLDNIYHISNGVDLEQYTADEKRFTVNDKILESDRFKVVYAGSIRQANKIDEFVNLADILKHRGNTNIDFIIYGDGDQRDRLIKMCNDLNLDNIHFMGRVDKNKIPYILSKCDLNIATDESNNLGKYGISWNLSLIHI